MCRAGIIRTGAGVDRTGEDRWARRAGGGRRAGESRGENRKEAVVWVVQPGFDPSRWEVSSVR